MTKENELHVLQKKYEHVCKMYNVEPYTNWEQLEMKQLRIVYNQTCTHLGLPSSSNYNKRVINPAELEAEFLNYVRDCGYKSTTVSFTKEGYRNKVTKPVILSVAGFKRYLYERKGIKPFQVSVLLLTGDYQQVRETMYTIIESWMWDNTGKSYDEIDYNSSRMYYDTRVVGMDMSVKTHDEQRATPESYRQAVLAGLKADGRTPGGEV